MAEKFTPCLVAGCKNNATPGKGGAKGYCGTHYVRLKKHGDPNYVTPRPHRRERECSMDGCTKPVANKDLCSAHYTRLLRHGSPLGGGDTRGFAWQWLLDHVNHTGDDCLIWPFARLWNGHGHLRKDGKDKLVHREMCRMAHGEPPSEIHEAAHSCGKAHDGCVNPNHLSWKTPKENAADKKIHGTQPMGEKVAGAILTRDQVRWIRRMIGIRTHQEMADELGVSVGCVQSIAARKTWEWLVD